MNNKPINMMINKEKLEKLKTIARERSFKTSKDVIYTDLIREAIDIIFFNNGGEQDGEMDKMV